MHRRHFLTSLGSLALLAQKSDAAGTELEWHDARKLTVEGLGFKDVKSPYDRLPARAEGVVRPAIWGLSHDSAGVTVRFVASTPAIHARWTITKETLAPVNTPPIGGSGLDLYARTDAGKWRWLAIGRPADFPRNECALVSDLSSVRREFMLYFPLRNAVTSLEIGVPKSAGIMPGPTRTAGSKPLVFYGTSITHGGAASRPGMTHVAILGRVFDREVINLGFAGNGRMEAEVVKFVAELDPAVFILDCLPNMNAELVRERTVPGVKILRAAHPQTPILLVEDRNFPRGFFAPAARATNEANHAALRESYAALRKENVPNIYYLKADDLLGDDGEATVDGSHPSDLGFVRQATAFEKVLRPILK